MVIIVVVVKDKAHNNMVQVIKVVVEMVDKQHLDMVVLVMPVLL